MQIQCHQNATSTEFTQVTDLIVSLGTKFELTIDNNVTVNLYINSLNFGVDSYFNNTVPIKI